MNKYILTVIKEPLGGYSAFVENLPGTGGFGPTPYEAMKDAIGSMDALMSSYESEGKEPPLDEFVVVKQPEKQKQERPVSKSDINITDALNRVVKDLSEMGNFKGAYIYEAACYSRESLMEDMLKDNEGLEPGDEYYKTMEQMEEHIRNYNCLSLWIDYHELYKMAGWGDSEFVETEFDYYVFERAFKDWLLPYFDNDESLISEEINFDGGDNEFIRKIV